MGKLLTSSELSFSSHTVLVLLVFAYLTIYTQSTSTAQDVFSTETSSVMVAIICTVHNVLYIYMYVSIENMPVHVHMQAKEQPWRSSSRYNPLQCRAFHWFGAHQLDSTSRTASTRGPCAPASKLYD